MCAAVPARVRKSIYITLYSISLKVAIEKDEKIQNFSKNNALPLFKKLFFCYNGNK